MIDELRKYLSNIIKEITEDDNLINIDFLGTEPDDYSIDRIPVQKEVEKWITGITINREVYNLRARKPYSIDDSVNLLNAGFFEKLENAIKINNKKGNLPSINGIENIECLSCASVEYTDTNTAVFSMQFQIKYKEEE